MLTVGQFATDVHSGKTVRVIGIQQVFGMVTYQVYEPETGNIYNAAERTLKIDRGLSEPSSAFVRFAAVYARVKNELANGSVVDVSESVIPLPHQRYALERAMATNEVRYMLADEVGLGKTIEAGLIIKELQTRGLIERVLVVCPKGLMTQWEAEMQEIRRTLHHHPAGGIPDAEKGDAGRESFHRLQPCHQPHGCDQAH